MIKDERRKWIIIRNEVIEFRKELKRRIISEKKSKLDATQIK